MISHKEDLLVGIESANDVRHLSLACFFASDYLLSAGFKELQIVFKNNFLAVYIADSFNKFHELGIQRFVVSS